LGSVSNPGPEPVAAFALSNGLIKPAQVPSELHRFAKILASALPPFQELLLQSNWRKICFVRAPHSCGEFQLQGSIAF
jgi:hypothetical protein